MLGVQFIPRIKKQTQTENFTGSFQSVIDLIIPPLAIALMEVTTSQTSLITSQVLASLSAQLAEISCTKSSTISFIKGFILGQLSVIVVVVLVLRYLFTEDVKRVKKVSKLFLRKTKKLTCSISVLYLRGFQVHHRLDSMLQHLYPTIISLRKHIMT
jgi:hypothetical protein